MKTIYFEINDKELLKQLHMPFLKRGGLFLPSHQPLQMGEIVQVNLKLFDELMALSFKGKVVWIPHKEVPDQTYGLHFLESEMEIIQKIIYYLEL